MRKRLTFANVCSFLALVVALGTGGAYAANTIGSTDIINGQVRSADIGTRQVRSIDVEDHGLTGSDIGQAQFIDFIGQIGVVDGSKCVHKKVTGLPFDNKDHMLLTPSVTTAELNIGYSAEYDASENGDMWIQACNHTNAPIDAGTTNFNLLVIDAR